MLFRSQEQWAKGVPVVMADAGENTRALVQAASGFRHPAKQQMVEDIFTRQGNQGLRAIQKVFSIGRLGFQNAYDAADQVMEKARATAAPFYERAHATEIYPTKSILDLLKQPEFQAAWEAGRVTAAGEDIDRKSTRLNSSHIQKSRMPSSA